MEHFHQYRLRKSWVFCVNILPHYFDDLIRMSLGNIEEFLEYLYEKYKKRLINLRISERKRTATANYQERRKIYKRKKITMSSSIWQKYWDLRLNTGYSMSCIIRIFIEWEKLNRGEYVDPEELYLPPIDIEEDERLEYRYPNQFRKGNNYQIQRKWRRHNRMLYFRYIDDS